MWSITFDSVKLIRGKVSHPAVVTANEEGFPF